MFGGNPITDDAKADTGNDKVPNVEAAAITGIVVCQAGREV
jgi:hypothetical protein